MAAEVYAISRAGLHVSSTLQLRRGVIRELRLLRVMLVKDMYAKMV